MPRPPRIRVLEAHEIAPDGIYLWADVDGTEVCFLITPGAIANRKLAYGYARTVEETQKFGFRRIERVVGERSEDLSADADDLALQAILAEHLDRFEETSYDWVADTPPLRPESAHSTRRRTDLERSFDVPARTPPVNRRPPRREPRRQA